jgi:hypothetical protein
MRLVEFQLESGGRVFVEVDYPTSEKAGMGPAGVADVVAQNLQTKFEHVLDGIPPVTEALLSRLASLSSRPDEVSIRLGFKIAANATLILTSTAVEVIAT